APAQPLGPGRQEPAISRRQSVLAIAPRHHLHGHSASLTVHTPHAIRQEDHDTPPRHELEPPLIDAVIGRANAATAGTTGASVPPRPHLDHQSWTVLEFLQASSGIDE